MAKLTTPRVRFVLDDDSEHEVQVLNVDLLAWDRDRARRGWPAADQAPFVWLTYLAYKAGLRLGLIPQMTLDEFETKALEVEAISPDETTGVSEVDPTPPAVGPA